jgi:hypothetical protein|eukprot:SAG25_NODE_592_length_6685_cov_34.632098_2_plen_98_part_00
MSRMIAMSGRYARLMQFRTKLLWRMLRHGASIWVVEADATWFGDPSAQVTTRSGYDVLTGQDNALRDWPADGKAALLVGAIPEGGFLYLNATFGTLR